MTLPDVSRYLDLPWQVEIWQESLSDGTPVFVAQNPELRGCMAQGTTREEALASLREARELYLEVLIDHGQPIPAPAEAPEAVTT